jgi:GT2 family glycosyltransferase
MRKVTLIILAWNRWDLTRACLDSLLETELADAEVLVVDNGSTDETPDRLAELADPRVRVLRLNENVGFVRGNNAGIEAADPTSDVLLLNNDLIFGQRDWLQRLRAAAETPGAGVVGCRLVLPDGRLLHAGTYIVPDTCWGQQIGALETDLGQYGALREVEGIVFACAFIRREVVEAIGGLALDFESYFEDTDYCLRARQAGFKVLVAGDVTLVHDEHGSTRGADRERSALFQTSREIFRRKWEEELSARYRGEVAWQSIMNFPTGYAMSCRELLRALEQERVRTTYSYLYGPGTVFPLAEPKDSGDYLLNVIRGRRPSSAARATVVYGQADAFERGRGRYRVGYTMLEVDGFPAEWVRQANTMDEIWVPSAFNRDGMESSGVRRPIHLMPLGVDTDTFNPRVRGVRNRHEFVFLATFEWGERKNPALLLQAFSDTFSHREPVRLVCKINNTDPRVHIKKEIAALRLPASGGRMSFLFNLEFPHYQLAALYRSADCFVSAGRGEGWDMPLMEAMACGLPAIATDWGAHREFVDARVAYPLAVGRTIPAVARCPYYDGFSWADPDADHLRFLMREVYENQSAAAARGAAAAVDMAERWTWRHAARRIAARLSAVSD